MCSRHEHPPATANLTDRIRGPDNFQYSTAAIPISSHSKRERLDAENDGSRQNAVVNIV